MENQEGVDTVSQEIEQNMNENTEPEQQIITTPSQLNDIQPETGKLESETISRPIETDNSSHKNQTSESNVKQLTIPQNQQLPEFWDLLCPADQEAYNRMRLALSSPACKHRRHHSKELNRGIVNTIKSFVVRNDNDDYKRALVTGIVWLPNAIAINTRQLRLLLSKCKSSINALFQNLGYFTIPTNTDYSSSIISCFPLLRDNFTELRKWTIRLMAAPPDNKAAYVQQPQQQNIAQPNLPQQIPNQLPSPPVLNTIVPTKIESDPTQPVINSEIVKEENVPTNE